MIDIHPPHHGGITRRDFFIHLFTVILGILIAISLEQTVEYLHHRQRAIQIALADDDVMLNYCFTIKRNLPRNPGI